MQQFKYDAAVPFFNMLVQTVETTKLSYLLIALVQQGVNAIVIGTTGVGKSVIVSNVLGVFRQKQP